RRRPQCGSHAVAISELSTKRGARWLCQVTTSGYNSLGRGSAAVVSKSMPRRPFGERFPPFSHALPGRATLAPSSAPGTGSDRLGELSCGEDKQVWPGRRQTV